MPDREVPFFFLSKDVPEILAQLRLEDSVMEKLLNAKFVDGGKEIRCPMIVEYNK